MPALAKHAGWFAASALLMSVAQAADVAVSVAVDQPGFYGRVDIGRLPPPPLLYPEPILVRPSRVVMVQQPVYLHVPPGHAKHWNKHCNRYQACGQPVYFVPDDWYQTVYVPARREGRPDKHPGRGKHGKGQRNDD